MTTRHILRQTIVLVGLMLTACNVEPPTPTWSWSQWRGPGGLGVAPSGRLPTTWSPDSANVRWKTEVPGLGNSSPIVSNGKVFVTSEAMERRLTIAYDLETGEKLWETALTVTPKKSSYWNPHNTHAAPTPAADGQHIYVYFDDTLACLDYDGKIVWQIQADPDYWTYIRYGASSSPVLTKDSIILMQDREFGDTKDKGWIAAFAKKDGAELWRHDWDHTCCSYSTPVVIEHAGSVQIVSAKPLEVLGRDPKTGETIWEFRHDGMIQNVPSLTVLGDMIFPSGGVHDARTFGLRLSGQGASSKVEKLWSEHRRQPQTSSPVAYKGMLFTVTDDAVMSCYDIATGKLHWAERIPTGSFHACLAAGDDKIYAQNRYGMMIVVAAEPEYKLLAENRVYKEDSNPHHETASPALIDGAVLIRAQGHLFRIDAESKPAQ